MTPTMTLKKRPRASCRPPQLLYVKTSTTTGSLDMQQQRRHQQHHHPLQLVAAAGPRRAGMLLGVPYLSSPSLLEQRRRHGGGGPPAPLHGHEEEDDEVLLDDGDGGDAQGETVPPTTTTTPATTTKEVALMGTPSDAPFDHQTICRLQLHFVSLAVLGVVLGGVLLAHPQAMDPSLVLDGPAAVDSSVPGRDWMPLPDPFERVAAAALRAYVPVYVVSVLLAAWGVGAALLVLPLGLKVYSLAAFLHLLHAALFAPYLVYVPCLLPTVVMIFVAEKLYNRLVPAWLLVPGMWRRL